MVSAQVLTQLDFNVLFVVESNASSHGIDVVLSQKGKPLAFFNKALSPRLQAMSVYEKQMLTILAVMKKWNAYFLGRHFQIKTNHHNLKFLHDQKTNTPTHQLWVIKMIGYDYELVFRKRVKNAVVDASSRLP